MYWNFRVCKELKTYDIDKEEVDNKQYEYSIREVYYNEHGEITYLTENPVSMFSDSKNYLLGHIESMTDASKKEVIDLDNIVFAKTDFE